MRIFCWYQRWKRWLFKCVLILQQSQLFTCFNKNSIPTTAYFWFDRRILLRRGETPYRIFILFSKFVSFNSTNVCFVKILSFWIGSQYIENQWFWLDNRKISLTNYDGYPKWGLLQPSENEIDVGILISNSPELSTQSENGTRPLVWATYRNNFKNGFVCEKEGTLKNN